MKNQVQLVTFGEALLRFSARRGERLETASSLDFYLGGSELNIAANAQALGLQSAWISILPDSDLGLIMREKIERLDVDVTYLKNAPGRVGWYLMEQGAAPRPDVVFERSRSLLADQKNIDFDWAKIFSSARVFHTSGITAGLSETCTAACLSAMRAARTLGNVLVSYDFNFRKTIWSFEESVRRQKPLLGFIDILFASKDEVSRFFDIGETPREKWIETIQKSGFPLRAIVLTVRSENEAEYGVDVITLNGVHQSVRFPVSNVDRIGVGDAMVAAFLQSRIGNQDVSDKSWEVSANEAAAAGALKYSISGDMALIKQREIAQLLNSGYRGIVR